MNLLRALGRRSRPRPGVPDGHETGQFLATLTAGERALIDRARPYTMTGPERMAAVLDAVAYVLRRDVPGALVECGVWRGGSVLLMILALQQHSVDDRDIYLFDTFEGMTAPTEKDTSALSEPALAEWERAGAAGERAWSGYFDPDVFSLEQVQRLLWSTGYPRERLHFEVGPVEETLPGRAPRGIALLRLDTDWYESTRHELVHLYPRLSPGGVLIVDDYGHWEGSRRAVDEYFGDGASLPLLTRIDYTARMAVKPDR